MAGRESWEMAGYWLRVEDGLLELRFGWNKLKRLTGLSKN
jgi:hypothetical protein